MRVNAGMRMPSAGTPVVGPHLEWFGVGGYRRGGVRPGSERQFGAKAGTDQRIRGWLRPGRGLGTYHAARVPPGRIVASQYRIACSPHSGR